MLLGHGAPSPGTPVEGAGFDRAPVRAAEEGPRQTGRGVTVSGRVVDARRLPVAGAEVRVIANHQDDRSAAFPVLTNASGQFTFTDLPRGLIALGVRCSGYIDEVNSLGWMRPLESKETVELMLSEGNVVAGQVVWPSGEVCPGSRLEVLAPAFDGLGRRVTRALVRDAVADIDGRFRFAALAEGPYTIVARAPEPDEAFASEIESDEDSRSEWSATIEGVNGSREYRLELEPGNDVRGLVFDDRGLAVERFTVLVLPIEPPVPASREFARMAETFTSTSGEFVLQHVPGGDWRIVVRSEEHAPSADVLLTLPHPEDAEPLQLTVPRFAHLEGRVVTPLGSAIDAVVHVQPLEASRGGGGFDGIRRTRTDATGDFALADLTPGGVRIWAEAPGYAPSASLELYTHPDESFSDLRLELRRSCRLSGALDASVRPIFGRAVRVESEEGSAFTLPCDGIGRFVANELPAGRYFVSLCAEGGESDEAFHLEGHPVVVQLQPDEAAFAVLSAMSGKTEF